MIRLNVSMNSIPVEEVMRRFPRRRGLVRKDERYGQDYSDEEAESFD
jgi:hypothetical protein